MDLQSVEALHERLSLLARAEDPARVASLSTELLERLRQLQQEVSALRDSAVVTLHDGGSSLHEIARGAGLTRGRVFQIVQRGRSDSTVSGPSEEPFVS